MKVALYYWLFACNRWWASNTLIQLQGGSFRDSGKPSQFVTGWQIACQVSVQRHASGKQPKAAPGPGGMNQSSGCQNGWRSNLDTCLARQPGSRHLDSCNQLCDAFRMEHQDSRKLPSDRSHYIIYQQYLHHIYTHCVFLSSYSKLFPLVIGSEQPQSCLSLMKRRENSWMSPTYWQQFVSNLLMI